MDEDEAAVKTRDPVWLRDKAMQVGRSLPVTAVRRALSHYLQVKAVDRGADGEPFNGVWDALIERARRGDPAALRMYLEYTAGKPVQEIEVTPKQSIGELSDEDLVRVAGEAAKALK